MFRIANSILAKHPLRQLALVFLAYEAFYLALFFQFPYQDALPGNVLLAIALPNTYLAKIAAFFGFGSAGTAMFPVSNALAYGEAAPGMSAIYVFFRLLGCNDVFSSYFYNSFVFASTALGTYVFAGLFLRSRAARFFAGFAFTCSNMMFAHIDDSPFIFYLFPLLSLTLLVTYFRGYDTTDAKSRWLLLAAVLGGVQAWFSVYIYVFQTILLGIIGLYYLYKYRERQGWSSFGLISLAILFYGLAAGPVLLFYDLNQHALNIAKPFHTDVLPTLLSWSFHDLFQALPENLLYGRPQSMNLTWDLLKHENLIGILVTVAGVFALWRRGEHRLVLGTTALVGFVFALGPMIMAGAPTTQMVPAEQFYKSFLSSGIAPAPLYPIYKLFPMAAFLRVPVRAYFLVLLALSVLSAVTLDALVGRCSRARTGMLIVGLFFAVHMIENVPFPMRAYPLGPLLKLPDEYAEFVKGKTGAVILDLPSRLDMAYLNWNYELFREPRDFVSFDPSAPVLEVLDRGTTALSYRLLFNYNREAVYMNWQTQHKQNIIGGVNGYFPVSRLIYDRWLEDLPRDSTIEWLRQQGVDFIAYHPNMLLPGETDYLPQLAESPLLRRVYSGKQITVFALVEPPNGYRIY
jgi:hypothetical protein